MNRWPDLPNVERLPNGLKLIENDLLVDSKTVDRTRRERWLSWPWRPWQRTKIVSQPSTDCYVTGGMVICHPATAQRIRAAFRA